ncbi:MAG TPA: tRNA methyl transferase PRC-barrel domain-containing protein, partial [Candidatus Nanopelagicales bacterium]|nr:tRNA methyl transferase PRC-barrel domain-containing protein [Candidatus Nanopelagicales bacterium]
QLAGAMFPLGGSRKSEVRAEAAGRGLLVADKPDSHDICFIPDGDTAGWLAQRLGSRPGDVVDAASGERVGGHDGSYAFTIGQRRGLGLSEPAEDGARRYVVDIDAGSGTVLVGLPTMLDVDLLHAGRVRWCSAPARAGHRLLAQVRAHGEAVPATLLEPAAPMVVRLDQPLRGVAPGQAVVLYDGDRVVGSATISRASRVGERGRATAPAPAGRPGPTTARTR